MILAMMLTMMLTMSLTMILTRLGHPHSHWPPAPSHAAPLALPRSLTCSLRGRVSLALRDRGCIGQATQTLPWAAVSPLHTTDLTIVSRYLDNTSSYPPGMYLSHVNTGRGGKH